MSRGENSKTPGLSARSGHARNSSAPQQSALKTSTAQKIPMNRLQDSSVRPHHTELQHCQCLMTSSSYVYPSTVSLQPAPTRRRAGRYSPRLAVPPADQQTAMPCEPATRSKAHRSEPERRAVDVARCRRCRCCCLPMPVSERRRMHITPPRRRPSYSRVAMVGSQQQQQRSSPLNGRR